MRDGWRLISAAAADRIVGMDPELEAFITLFPPAEVTDPATGRETYAMLAASAPAPDLTDIEVEDRLVPASQDVPVRIYRPRAAKGAVVWLHGGGWFMGNLDTEHPWAGRIAAVADTVVVSVGYRLAPENPFPAALDDGYAALRWTVEHATELGIDPARIAIGGHSAGGCLAAALALRARDEQGPAIRFQLLSQPSLDDRQQEWSARNFTDTPWSTRDKVAQSWHHYLGGQQATPYAAPARATDLAGLPPTYMTTAEFCPNRDEDIGYALRLMQAGVSVELHQWPGTFHGSQAILHAEVSQRQITELGDVLRRALAD
jgi:acetyl esterase/lipase